MLSWGRSRPRRAGTDDLKAAYGVFKAEARDIAPEYAPKTVNTDGWTWTQAAWKALFPQVVMLLCFLHAWLKIRDRAKHLKELFAEVSRRVWEAYHAPDRRSFGQRLRRLRQWAGQHLTGIVLEKVLDLCGKRERWSIGVPPSRRSPHEQHAGPADAGDESLLRPRPTPARLVGGVSPALPGVGVVVRTSHPGTRRRRGGTRAGGVPPNASTGTVIMTVGCKIY